MQKYKTIHEANNAAKECSDMVIRLLHQRPLNMSELTKTIDKQRKITSAMLSMMDQIPNAGKPRIIDIQLPHMEWVLN